MNREEVVEKLKKENVTIPIVFAEDVGCDIDSLDDPETFNKASEVQLNKWIEERADKFMEKQDELNIILPPEPIE